MATSPRRAGIFAPLFTVYSPGSCGTGDFHDLELLIDLCAGTGNSILHLAPLNEMSAAFDPYSPFSCFALEPMHASFGPFFGYPGVRERCRAISAAHPAGRSFFDPQMKEKKFNLLWDIYVHEADGRKLDETKLAEFRERNASWLDDFALFKVIRDSQGKRPWYEWEEPYRTRDPAALAAFSREHEKELRFDYWVQMQLHSQLAQAADHARARGVTLKGELPLRIGRDCADVWQHQELFRLELDSSAPPDTYFPAGKRSDAPPCDWDAMAEDGYTWLRSRLAWLARSFGMLRIAHPEELWSSWAVPRTEPRECGAANGFYLPEGRIQQQRQAHRLVSVLRENWPDLLSAEDLERCTGDLGRLLRQRGIMGNYLHRKAKEKTGQSFLDPKAYRRESIAMLSSGQGPDWSSWWELEAGTVDEDTFTRVCDECGIDPSKAKETLTEPGLSRPGRLRWKPGFTMSRLITRLASTRHRLSALISLYLNGAGEKEKAWMQISGGTMEEQASPELARKALSLVLGSSSGLSINSLADWAYAAGSPPRGRPVSLDTLAEPRSVEMIRAMVETAQRRMPGREG